jgi:hypothetical protein
MSRLISERALIGLIAVDEDPAELGVLGLDEFLFDLVDFTKLKCEESRDENEVLKSAV